MPQTSGALKVIYVEGETKTGKGAASEAIANALKDQGLAVYYDVAGDFFRRFTAIIRRTLALSETDPLPPREDLIKIATELYESGEAFVIDPELGDLQRPEISNCVSQLGELPIAQKAAIDWYNASVRQAVEGGSEVMVLDGRNPRRHVEQHVPEYKTKTILDVYMICVPEVAARRVLLGEGITDPSPEQLEPLIQNITERRSQDRQRPEWPFWWPDRHISLIPGEQSAEAVVAATWETDVAEAPLPVVIDNSYVPKPIMWQAVEDLATSALSTARATM